MLVLPEFRNSKKHCLPVNFRLLLDQLGIDPEKEGEVYECGPEGTLRAYGGWFYFSGNHNHDLKAIFKSAATMASSREGPFHDFYQGLLTQGMRPAMARLTLARKIAAITLILWKKGHISTLNN